MKESVSLTTIFQIVILFILLFTAIMALTINNSNAFAVKDSITNIIELSEGNFLVNKSGNLALNDELVNSMSENSYRTIGTCEEGYTGFQKDGTKTNGTKSAICIKCTPATKEKDAYFASKYPGVVGSASSKEGNYYSIVVFYQLDIPVLNQVYNFQTKGETKIIFGPGSELCE